MAVNASFAGREYPGTAPFEVGREHLREFARAVGATHPAHHDVDAARSARPPRRRRAADLRRRHRAARRGAAHRRPRRRHRLLARRARRRAVHPPPADPRRRRARDRPARGRHHASGPAWRWSRRACEIVATPTAPPSRPSARRSPCGVRAHDPPGASPTSPSARPSASRTVEVRRVDLVRYAGASGDFNTIHWNDRIAREVGLPGVIAHGMFTMGAGRERRHRLGRRPGRDRRLRRAVHAARPGAGPGRRHRRRSRRVIGAIDADAAVVRVDLTVTFDGAKVLGKAQVQVSLG